MLLRNLLFTAAFDGSAFHGWQQQKNASSVQETVKNAVFSLTGENVSVTGCSRTDAGVHARQYCFNFKTESTVPESGFVPALLTRFPKELAVFDCKKVRPDFNARFDCLKKEYEYVIYNEKIMSPFLHRYAYHYRFFLDEKLLNSVAREYVGTYDFSAFCASGAQVKSKVRTVYDASVRREGENVIFKVSGDGFLYNMVRIMAGTLIAVNENKIACDEIKSIINEKDRTRAGVTLPPQGLYLNRVFYGGDIYEEA